ncbi:Uncharacterised protein [Klebsiella oxytoca]|nr:hypothetical protein CSC17_2885 [Klebsiella oxytoca]EHS89305.1 hypothetical protein HMPREF9689_04974 [Klebsiella oxytoca 10-5245]ESM65449.1 hypothetical protein L388_05281 [Klebsiella oxytoca MGH 42]ESN09745.1 hypothetical protein L374_00583 [Klebsiella oxytoca MGH 28]EUC88539.1 hypothetical protein HMPREF1569_2795 [Klebsiella oxytoca OK-1]KMV95670.1 hypothetical protein HMPREF9688_01786 [Klebsiella oxytoca 10-5244]KMV97110.1 hypothetical protein HMPREF9693_03455 [Klebsiella oxytoca 10-524
MMVLINHSLYFFRNIDIYEVYLFVDVLPFCKKMHNHY